MFVLSSILQPLLDLNEAVLKFWHDDVGLSWGASIIGLTVVIRLAILPLNYKQIRSMQALQRLQPEMKKLQARYKDDKKRLNEEMMKFYQEHKVNPLGSCLPLIFQLPFFFSLYQLQRSAHFKAEVGHSAFLFIPDITEPLTGYPVRLAIVLVLYVATQLASSLVTASNIQDKTQRRIMLIFPFAFVPIVMRFQAGLLIYWITTNIWTIGQQLFVKRFMPAPEPLVAAAPAAAAVGGGGGGKASAPAKRKAPAANGSGKSEPAAAKASNGKGNGSAAQKPPPSSPRKRKKRSGRRR